MYASTSFSTSHLIHDILVPHTRKLLGQHIQSPSSSPSMMNLSNSNTTTADHSYFGNREFEANVVMILDVLLCALICSLGLNSIIKCGLRSFSNIVISDYSSSGSNNSSTRSANKGIKKKALKKFPTVSYTAELKLPGLDTECVICISEFTEGEKVRILPKCNHGFHVCCIDKWLSSHSSCPKCRQCLVETCPKIGGSQVQPIVLPVPETIIQIQPLEPEALESHY